MFLILLCFACSKYEDFITISALNVHTAEKIKRLKYYDRLYGYDEERWRRAFPSQFYKGNLYGMNIDPAQRFVDGKRIY